jgi:hypothetical protein
MEKEIKISRDLPANLREEVTQALIATIFILENTPTLLPRSELLDRLSEAPAGSAVT